MEKPAGRREAGALILPVSYALTLNITKITFGDFLKAGSYNNGRGYVIMGKIACSLAAVYKCLHADHDVCRDSLHSCTFRRRLQKSHVVREWIVSSYAVPDFVRHFLFVLGAALFSMGHPGRYYIHVWNHHVGHELERPFRRAVPFFQGQKPEWDSYRSVDDGADCHDHLDFACDPLGRKVVMVISQIRKSA